jgi:hypothetical protein
MRSLTLLAAAATIGAVAAPAAAQYYPAPTYPQQQYPYPGQAYPAPGYPQQPGYGYPPQQGGLSGVIGQLLGNRYAVNDRTAITQCASAAQAQVAQQYGGGYGNRPYNGYNQGYNQGYGQSRVTAITQVERRNRGLRVTGLIASGQAYGGGYNQQYGGADLSFRCNVDYNGAVTNLRVNRLARRY